MVDLSALLDQLEEWIEAQVPPNLSELPHKMLETAERLSNELMDTLSMHGPPSISIPFPPFGKEEPPPPPPPPAPKFGAVACNRAHDLARKHPYLVAGGAALAVTVGIGTVGMITGVGVFGQYGREWRLRRQFGTRGVVENGMLKEAIVILAPSPSPPILVPLTATLLKAGYVVIVAVPNVKAAESIERRLSGLAEKGALRVLIYDTEEPNTFPPFHRSLMATLTLRFPAPSSTGSTGHQTTGDPYNPQPSHVPHIHAFVSLYPLNPSPPSQPGALPALPTLMQPDASGRTPMLVTLYPSSSSLVMPDSFASQVLTVTHRLLGENLGVSTASRVLSVVLGHITLPSLPAIITEGRTLSRRELARQKLRESAKSPAAAMNVVRDVVTCAFSSVYRSISNFFGVGAPSRDYSMFESYILSALKSSSWGRSTYYVGQGAWSTQVLGLLPARTLPRLLTVLPTLPSETGPAPAPPPKGLRSSAPASRSASSSDHDGEDLVSSVHTAGTTQSSADSSGLEGSWVGLDHA